jgi:hypothetical protein
MQGRPPIGTHFFIFYYTGLIRYYPTSPRIPGWLSAHFRLSKARSNEIRPPPTG